MRANRERKDFLKFQEYFADQDLNIDDYIYEQVPNTKGTVDTEATRYNQTDELPIQLIRKKNTGEFVVNRDALDLIASYDKPVALVCLAGKYRTGKSFLLNKLMNLKGKGFKVSNSTDACTEGIWMWSRPIYNKKEDFLMFIIDTEGSEATNRNAQHDAKIFTLGILISSYFIYNSVGAIDEPSINQLNLVTALSKSIAAKGNIPEESLHLYMPKFLWLLRDFVLEIRDQYGKQRTPTEYLEYSLDPKKGSEQARSVKKALMTVFRDRDCMVLIRPADQETDLKNLDSISQSRLRPQFMEGVNNLRNKILNSATPKVMNGEPLTTQTLGLMIQAYVDSINKGAIPNILTAWEHIEEEAALEAYDAALEAYSQKFDSYFPEDAAKDDQDLLRILKELRDVALDTYDYNVQTPNENIRNKLKNFLDEKQRTIILINEQFSEAYNIKILNEYSQALIKNVEAGKYSSENPEALNDDLNRLITRYNADAMGSKKCQVLTLFLTNFNAMILKSYNDTTRSKYNMRNANNTNRENQCKQYLKQIQILQGRLDTTQRRLQTKDLSAERELEEERRKLQQARDEAASMRKQLDAIQAKKKKNKCCFF